MIQIVIYHGNSDVLQTQCKCIAAYFEKVRHTYRIYAYANKADVEKHFREYGKKIDVFLADCSDPKQVLPLLLLFRDVNQQASWVCTDTDIQTLLKLMLLRPSAYLKSATETQPLLDTIRKLDVYHRQFHKKENFSFKHEGEYIRIPFQEISYFESNAKKVTLHLANSDRTYHFTAKLDDIESQLPDFFLRCHQSYLVNQQKIRRFDSKERLFLLASSEEIFISRRNFSAVKDAYLTFIASREEEPFLT